MEDREARILGEVGVGFGEGAEVKARAASGSDCAGVAAIEAEAYAGAVCGGLVTLRHDLRLPYT